MSHIALLGAMLYLLAKQFESFWAAPGIHFAWNYTRQYLFDLPNSGYATSYALANVPSCVGSLAHVPAMQE